MALPADAIQWPSFSISSAIGTIDMGGATTRRAAAVLVAPQTGQIDKVGFYLGSANNVAGVVSIETVATTGHPTGTLVAAGAEGPIPTGAANWREFTIGTPPTVTKGTTVAIVGRANAVGTLNFVRLGIFNPPNVPYGDYFNGTTWAIQTAQTIIIGVHYVEHGWALIPGMAPITNFDDSFNRALGSAINERGNKFVMASPVECAGAWHVAAGSVDSFMQLYEDDVVVRSGTASQFTGSAGAARYASWAPYTLDPTKTYRITAKPSALPNSLTWRDFMWANDDVATAISAGNNFTLCHRGEGGAWTETIRRRTSVGIIISEIPAEEGAGLTGRLKVMQDGVLVDVL